MATTKKGIYYPTDYTKPADVPDDMKKLAESVDEAIGNIPQYDDTGIKKDISDLKKEQSTQNKQISDNTKKNTQQDTEISKLQTRVQQLQANMINETTEEATSLHVTNVAELPAKLEIKGNHKQKMREGYNLVDISSLGSGTLQGVSYSVEDDVVTLNGAYTGSSAIPVGSLINSIPRKNATFRLQLVPVSGSSENSNIGIRFNKPNESGQNEQLNYIQLAGTSNNYATKTMDLTELSTVNFFFASNTSATFNNYKFKLMLTEGAEEKEYEHYGVSPSIDYPSEIEAVDNLDIIHCNSNFLEKQEQSTVTAYGITANVKTDGSIVVNGTATIDLYIRLTTELQISAYNETNNWKKYHLPQGSYKFSCDISGTSSSNNIHAYIKENNVIGKTCSVLPNLTTSKENTFELTDKIEYVAYVWIQGGTNLTDFTMKFMLKKSDDTSDYVQNKQKEYVLEVQQEMLQGDYFVKEADGWKEVHALNKKTFDGTENIGTSASGNSFTYVTNDLLNNTSQTDILSFYSNCYVASSWEERNYQSKPNTVASYGNSIGFDKGNFATPEEFKAELAEKYSQGNPMYLYYPLATPTKLSCTEAQSAVLDQISELPLNKGINNIITADDLALLQMTYTVDTKAYIDSKLGSEG